MAHTIITRDKRSFDVTAVDNTFLSDFMPAAPEGAVKVYLYGLMLLACPDAGEADMCIALGMEDSDIAYAFRYWEKQGIVRIAEGEAMHVQYLNVHEVVSESTKAARGYEKYRELIGKLQNVLGTRNLSGSELQKIYDWIEVFGFDEDAAVEIVRHCISVKGARVHINYMNEVAKRLVSDRCVTYEAVHDSFECENELIGGAAAILKRWRMGRRPTVDELALYEKWTHEWNFTDEAIDLACRDVVAIDRPNFKYLDAILSKYHENNSVSVESMQQLIREQDMIAELARQAFERAGMKRRATMADKQQFELWYHDWRVNPELILYASELASKKNTPFAEMKRLLADWHERGIASISAAKEDFEKNAAARPPIKNKSVSRALNYKQHNYSKDQLRELGVDLGEDVYED